MSAEKWWLEIPTIGSLEELFGSGSVEYVVFFDPDELRWLWDGEYKDCIVRKNTGSHTDELRAKRFTGWMFLVFGDAMRALRTLHETRNDHHSH